MIEYLTYTLPHGYEQYSATELQNLFSDIGKEGWIPTGLKFGESLVFYRPARFESHEVTRAERQRRMTQNLGSPQRPAKKMAG